MAFSKFNNQILMLLENGKEIPTQYIKIFPPNILKNFGISLGCWQPDICKC